MDLCTGHCRSGSRRHLVFVRLTVVTLPPSVPASHLPVFLSVVTSTLIAALLLTVSGVMISECPVIGVCVCVLGLVLGRRQKNPTRASSQAIIIMQHLSLFTGARSALQ